MGSERDLVCVAPTFSFSAVPVSVVSFAGDSQVSPSPRARNGQGGNVTDNTVEPG